MNIFIYDNNIKKNAQMHPDKHVVKQLLEYTQLLCSAYYYTDESHLSPYKLAHKNHPCTVWARESLDNWIYLRNLALELYEEYKFRYNDKDHKSGDIVLGLPLPSLKRKGLTKFALAMPENYKTKDAVTSYRDYFNGEKMHLAQWKNRARPSWIKELI